MIKTLKYKYLVGVGWWLCNVASIKATCASKQNTIVSVYVALLSLMTIGKFLFAICILCTKARLTQVPEKTILRWISLFLKPRNLSCMIACVNTT
jgi:hypothetical protein